MIFGSIRLGGVLGGQCAVVPGASVSGRGDPSLRAAVLPLRTGLRERTVPPPAPTRGRERMASGRGVRQDQRGADEPAAGRRPGRRRSRRPRPKPAGQGRRPALLSPPDDEARGPAGSRHRRAPLLRLRPPRGHAIRRAPAAEASRQPGGERLPAHPPARTHGEGLPPGRRGHSGSREASAMSGQCPGGCHGRRAPHPVPPGGSVVPPAARASQGCVILST